jgi:hypothetical protein
MLVWPFFPDSPLYLFKWPFALQLFVFGAFYSSGVIAQIVRYRRVSTPVERCQTRWVVYGLTVAFLGTLGYNLLAVLFPALTDPARGGLLYDLARAPVTYSFVLAIPITIGISILRFKLWDIDLIIDRTLVYIGVTAVLAGLYSALTTLLEQVSVALTGGESVAALVLTTLIITSAFTPVKDALDSIVEKRFKHPHDPARRLNQFRQHVQRFDDMMRVERLTRRLLQEAVKTFSAQGGTIRLESGASRELVYSVGQWNGQASISVPLEANGVRLGVLSLGSRRTGAPYTEKDRALLEQTAALVARAIQLAQKLRRGRARESPRREVRV